MVRGMQRGCEVGELMRLSVVGKWGDGKLEGQLGFHCSGREEKTSGGWLVYRVAPCASARELSGGRMEGVVGISDVTEMIV